MPNAILRNHVNEQNNGYAHEQNKTTANFTGEIEIHFLLGIVLSDEDPINAKNVLRKDCLLMLYNPLLQLL